MTGIMMGAIGSAKAALPILDTQTVTSGTFGGSDGYTYWNEYGFIAPGYGSVSDGTSNIYGGAAINKLSMREDGDAFNGVTSTSVTLSIAGTRANSGWTSMQLGSVSLLRTNASHGTFGGVTSWTWGVATGTYPISGTTVATFS